MHVCCSQLMLTNDLKLTRFSRMLRSRDQRGLETTFFGLGLIVIGLGLGLSLI